MMPSTSVHTAAGPRFMYSHLKSLPSSRNIHGQNWSRDVDQIAATHEDTLQKSLQKFSNFENLLHLFDRSEDLGEEGLQVDVTALDDYSAQDGHNCHEEPRVEGCCRFTPQETSITATGTGHHFGD